MLGWIGVGVVVLFVWTWMSWRDEQRRKAAYEDAQIYEPENIHGQASFADDAELAAAKCFEPGGIPTGFSKESGRPLFFKGTTHILSFGGTGAGKTSNSLIPAVLSPSLAKTSIVVFENMGELAATTSKYRAQFGPVYHVNPLGMMENHLTGFPRAGYNPMGRHWLDPRSNTFGTRAAKIAGSCVLLGSDRDRYWYHSSRGLVQAIIMAEARHATPADINLSRVAEIINDDPLDYARYVVKHTDDPFIQQKMLRYAVDPDPKKEIPRSLMEVIENARTEMDFLTDEAIAACVKRNDFTFGQCKKEVTTIYVMLPLEVLEVLGKINSLLLGSCLGELLREDGTGSVRTLIICEELYQYGAGIVDALGHAFASARKFNVQLWGCLNDLAQLKALAPNLHETFINNAGLVQWLAASDLDGSSYLSNLCGETEVYGLSKTLSSSAGIGYGDAPSDEALQKLQISYNQSQHTRRLMLPQEIRSLGPKEQILFMQGVRNPILCDREPYFETEAKHRAQPNPYYTLAGNTRENKALDGIDGLLKKYAR